MLAFVFFGLCASRSSLGLAASRLALRVWLLLLPVRFFRVASAKLEDISTYRRPLTSRARPAWLKPAPRPGRGSPHEAPRLRAAASRGAAPPRSGLQAGRTARARRPASQTERDRRPAGTERAAAARARSRTSRHAQLPGLRDTLNFRNFTTRSASRTRRVPRTTASSATCFSTRSSTRSTSRTTSVSNDRLSAVPPLAVRGRNVVKFSGNDCVF